MSQVPPYPLRMSEELRQRLQGIANNSDRSLNAEIISRLNQSLEDEKAPSESGLLLQDIQSLRQDLDIMMKQQQTTAEMVSRIADALGLGVAGK